MTDRDALIAQGLDPTHPESTCQRCGRSNVWSWSAPSPLWNAVMRNPETGEDRYSIVCPICFAQLVEEAGIGGSELDGRRRLTWRFGPDDFDVRPLWADLDGREWDCKTWLWREPVALDATPEPPALDAAWADQLSGEHAPHRGNHENYACGFSGPHCWECGEPWPCRATRPSGEAHAAPD